MNQQAQGSCVSDESLPTSIRVLFPVTLPCSPVRVLVADRVSNGSFFARNKNYIKLPISVKHSVTFSPVFADASINNSELSEA